MMEILKYIIIKINVYIHGLEMLLHVINVKECSLKKY